MEPINYLDRQTGQTFQEKVYGKRAIRLLYGDDLLSRIVGAPLLHLLSRNPIFSKFVGWWQNLPFTRNKIAKFVRDHRIDSSEFVKKIKEFTSFNDFFTRKLKGNARPIAEGDSIAVIPADGRHLFYPDIHKSDGFVVKGEKFSLVTLLEDEALAAKYEHGAMVIGRLCPSDYHRFHFPCNGVPGETRTINGWLYSVNPMAIKRDIHIFTQNTRTICSIDSEKFGEILYLEVGATSVGSITQTHTSLFPVLKGDEKGFFSFGGSTVIMLFEPGKIVLDEDLVEASRERMEVRCLMGQSLGSSEF